MTRPRYRERQLVTSSELTAEQAYLIGAARRHRVGEHTWGILAGLALIGRTADVLVQPGVAVDGYGRELVLPAAQSLSAAELDAAGGEVDVWLLYGRVADTPSQRGRWACGPGSHSRWRELPCLRLTAADDGPLDPRQPPAGEFNAEDEPPDTSAPAWPVLLGRVRAATAGFAVDPSRRPYAGLAGESIVHPLGTDELRIGGEPAGFAVRTRDAAGAFAEPLAVDAAGDVTISADSTLGGDLVLAGAPRSGLALTPLPAAPAAAAPWRAYRTGRQLRVELEHPGDKLDPRRRALSIGYDNVDGTFIRCVTVTADGTVTVTGDVHVDGVLNPGPIQADPDDPRFRAALIERWLGGIAGASRALSTIYDGKLALATPVLTPDSPAEKVVCDVRITNTGGIAFSLIVVGARVWRGDEELPPAGSPFGPPFALAVGESKLLSATFTGFHAGNPVTVDIAAGALAPAGYEVIATTSGGTEMPPIIDGGPA